MNKITILLAKSKGRMDVGLHKHINLNKVVFIADNSTVNY